MADRERQRLIFAHQEWLGFVQPVGLVVSPPVMVDAQVVPDRNVSGRQREFIALLERDDTGATARWRAPDLRRVFLDWLGWGEADLADADTDRERLEIALPELHAVLAPTWAVPADGGNEGGKAADSGNGEADSHDAGEVADSDGEAADISNGGGCRPRPQGSRQPRAPASPPATATARPPAGRCSSAWSPTARTSTPRPRTRRGTRAGTNASSGCCRKPASPPACSAPTTASG